MNGLTKSLCVIVECEGPARNLRPHGDPHPDDWPAIVEAPQTEAELAALRRSVARGRPFGHDAWVQRTAKRLGLEATLCPQGRPPKEPEP